MNPAPSGTPGADLDPAILLVVEDEVLIRIVVSDTLREAGFHVLEATNADEAVTLLTSFSEIALLFTDIQMPGSMDGEALVKFARANFPELAVIMTSGAVNRRPPEETTPFVSKPYAPEDIVARVRAILRDRENSRPSDPTSPTR
jgi:DNA-binding response OmpR family regulator